MPFTPDSTGPAARLSQAVLRPRAVSGRARTVRALRLAVLVTALGASAWLSGCVGLAATGMAVGAFASADRRTLGAQTDDQSIELKALGEVRDAVARTGGVSITSYNRKVLLTGQVGDADTRNKVEKVAAGLTNVRGVFNELQIASSTSFATATNDLAITTKVKAAMLDAKDVAFNNFKVVTEAGVVYLMGLVTRAEGDRAAQVTSRVSGVKRVVTLFEHTGN